MKSLFELLLSWIGAQRILDRIATLERKHDTMANTLEQIQTQLTRLDSAYTGLKGDVTGLKALAVDLKAQIAALTDPNGISAVNAAALLASTPAATV